MLYHNMNYIRYMIWSSIGMNGVMSMSTPIFSSAALKTRQREVKEVARRQVVHITENGNAAFVLMSEDMYDQKLREAAECAAYEARMALTIERARADIDAGRFVEGTTEALAEIERRAQCHG